MSMDGTGNEGARRRGGPRRRIDALAMGRFIQALRRGEGVEAAAGAAGFALTNFYRRRRKDAEFAAVWTEAMEASDAPRLIRPGNGRRLQLRKTRQLRFTAKRKDVFLAHFAGTCDLADAAEAAGVSVATVRNHRLKDPEFDAGCEAALEQGYKHLEEEAVSERLAARERLKAGIVPAGEAAAEFDRQMRLLSQWRRRDGRLGPMARSREALKRWSFDEAMALLEKRLKALKIPIVPPKRECEE
jgi:hypothetical protein